MSRNDPSAAEKALERQFRREERQAVHKANKQKRDRRLFALLVAPATLAFLLFVVWPMLYNIYLSFLNWNTVSPNREFVGFQNYINLTKDGPFLQSIENTWWYLVILLITCFAFPYILSYMMVHMIGKGQQVYRSILFFPSLVSLAVGSVVMSLRRISSNERLKSNCVASAKAFNSLTTNSRRSERVAK